VKRARAQWAGWFALSLLAACGGGGGGGPALATATPVFTASRTATAVASPNASPTATLHPTAVEAATPTLAATATAPAAATLTFTPTLRSTSTSAPAPSATPTVAPTLTLTLTPTVPPTPTRTFTPTITPIPSATLTLTAVPTLTLSPLPTATPTQTPLTGPIVSAFGIADGSGSFNAVADTDAQGRPIFLRQAGAGFVIYVEGRPGPSHLPVGTDRLTSRPGDPTRQPDLQIESSNNLGNGSAAVCDTSFPNVGGVPGISPADFSAIQSVSDALNDWSCRFKVYAETDFACTQDSNGNFLFGSTTSTAQFCTLVNDIMTFPSGDTVLTARLLDTAGNAGPSVQLIVRVVGGGS